MQIEWNDDLTTGNNTIDEQHKELISRFNSILAACNLGKGKDEVKNLLQFLGEPVAVCRYVEPDTIPLRRLAELQDVLVQ